MYIYNWSYSNVSSILLYTRIQVTTYMAHSPCFFSPLADVPLVSPCSLFNPFLLTWNPPSCDRICPPRSQVACKLTSPVPNPSPNPPPLQIPRTPVIQRLSCCWSAVRSGQRGLLSPPLFGGGPPPPPAGVGDVTPPLLRSMADFYCDVAAIRDR
jgi:hypothetical protein